MEKLLIIVLLVISSLANAQNNNPNEDYDLCARDIFRILAGSIVGSAASLTGSLGAISSTAPAASSANNLSIRMIEAGSCRKIISSSDSSLSDEREFIRQLKPLIEINNDLKIISSECPSFENCTSDGSNHITVAIRKIKKFLGSKGNNNCNVKNEINFQKKIINFASGVSKRELQRDTGLLRTAIELVYTFTKGGYCD